MPKKEMAVIDIDAIANLNDYECNLVEKILRPDGKLRLSKPKVPHKVEIKTGPNRWDTEYQHLTPEAVLVGEAAYVWRMVAFQISLEPRHHCMPVMADNDMNGGWEEKRPRTEELDSLVERIVDSVLADRGLYAPWLYRRIVRLHWHPFLRVNNGATFRPAGCARWYWLKDLVSAPNRQWQGRGTCFKDPLCRLECTLLAWWAEGNQDPWFILTDLAPTDSAVTWYGLRSWCEQGFKCNKRGGWQWQLTQMNHPERAARLWLAMAVATLWTVSVGTHLESGSNLDDPDFPALHDLLGHQPVRRIRLLRLGRLCLLVKAIAHLRLLFPHQLLPDPWPASLSPTHTLLTHPSESTI